MQDNGYQQFFFFYSFFLVWKRFCSSPGDPDPTAKKRGKNQWTWSRITSF